MIDFERYFLHNKQIILDNISYETLKTEPGRPETKLNCKDTILAQLTANGVKISFNRALNFEPEGIYSLSVTYTVFMIFDPSTKDEIDWAKTDIAGEFKRSCPQLISVMMSRASLLISQITSSSGQPPLITPGAPVQPKKETE